ncbi:glycerophosphodiester phosphodiesterase family protein [Nonomuraea sp. NBC_01738]|uniref:glycerophosphodiester phosphodiesterase family protein n=1 Tax=Nonomuraea sp. NBC_01738 TaxID=2976003 RepID=UPI002E14FC48|nr:glycerophosphodiester phosphodiesterase family protein [Nonomuraea sp. NBC_01738]
MPNDQPIVIAHRGASALRPEHTLLAYEKAIELGADYIEPDLVSTADHVLVARHENEISGTTDVAEHPEFAARRATKLIDGRALTGWFTEDFTLAELRTLRAVERIPELRPANAAFHGLIPTFREIVELAGRHGVGVYPETKHPAYFRSIGLPLEEPLLDTLGEAGMDRVFIQSFEPGNLRDLRRRTKLPLIQLIGSRGGPFGETGAFADMVTPEGLAEVARYADGVGVDASLVVPGFVDAAHAAGLDVHVWTVRNENAFLPEPYRRGANPGGRGDVEGWLAHLLAQGVDGAFCDDPGLGRRVVQATSTSMGRSSSA